MNFETSFVPQQPLLKVEGVSRPREPLNLSLIISLLIFFATLSVCGGAYFYKDSVDRQVEEKGKELLSAERLFEVDKINTYKTLQTTLGTAKSLADEHTIFSLIFDLLEARAASNIGLTALGFAMDGERTTLSLTGQAPTYVAAYFQVQKWREAKPMVESAEVTSLFLDELSGIVSFTVKVTLDPKTLGYARMLAASSAGKKSPPSNPVESTLPAQVAPLSSTTTTLIASTTKPAVNPKANSSTTQSVKPVPKP